MATKPRAMVDALRPSCARASAKSATASEAAGSVASPRAEHQASKVAQSARYAFTVAGASACAARALACSTSSGAMARAPPALSITTRAAELLALAFPFALVAFMVPASLSITLLIETQPNGGGVGASRFPDVQNSQRRGG